MNITRVTTDDLRHMEHQEGLIIRGCGGDLHEWVDGINEILKKEGILLNDTKFESVMAFEHEGMTCLIFPFEEADIAIGKLAMWRLYTAPEFGGVWLSDYVPNRLGGFVNSGEDCGAKISDEEVEDLWDELEDVPISENECLDEDWYIFAKGTFVEDIWYWFDEHHSKGVGWLMNEYERKYK